VEDLIGTSARWPVVGGCYSYFRVSLNLRVLLEKNRSGCSEKGSVAPAMPIRTKVEYKSSRTGASNRNHHRSGKRTDWYLPLSGPIDVKTESLGAEYVGYHMEISISILLESHGTFLKLSYGGSPICGGPPHRLRIRKPWSSRR
jgi:hypothetical protein